MVAPHLQAPIAIVGGGQAAARAAEELCRLGHAGPLLLIGDEPHEPYERPPLSKAMLQADGVAAAPVLAAAALADARLQRLQARVTRLDVQARLLHLADGRRVHYGRCLLATGGRVRTLPDFPLDAPQVHHLRTLEDARRLRGMLQPGARLAVVGGGFLGLEAALSARQCGVQVSLVEAAPTLLGRFVPQDLSDWLAGMLQAQGVALHLGQAIAGSRLHAQGVELQLPGGACLQADAVLVAVGLVPEVGLAREAGLALSTEDGGIVVAADGRTSDAQVFAAGDCASQLRPALGRTLRLESWQNANEQGRAAAAGLMDLAPPEPAFPWFWTDPGEHNIQMLGLQAPGLHYVRRGDLDAGRALWLGLQQDGIVVHGVALNAGGELRALRPLFEKRLPLAGDEIPELPGLRAWAKNRLAAHSAPAL